MSVQTVNLAGHKYVLIPKCEYERWSRRTGTPEMPGAGLPEIPLAGSDGTYPAVETGRALLARKIIKRRWALGWPQAKLARTAGVRPETLCRIEKCHVTPDLATINKLVAALDKAERQQNAGDAGG